MMEMRDEDNVEFEKERLIWMLLIFLVVLVEPKEACDHRNHYPFLGTALTLLQESFEKFCTGFIFFLDN